MLLARLRRPAGRRSGFTLLEVLVVVAILVILAGVASFSIFRYMEDAKVGRAKADMQAIKKACETYLTQKGEYPENNQIALIIPYLESGEKGLYDPWGQQYTIAQEQSTNQVDQTTVMRIRVYCQPPGGKPPIVIPEN